MFKKISTFSLPSFVAMQKNAQRTTPETVFIHTTADTFLFNNQALQLNKIKKYLLIIIAALFSSHNSNGQNAQWANGYGEYFPNTIETMISGDLSALIKTGTYRGIYGGGDPKLDGTNGYVSKQDANGQTEWFSELYSTDVVICKSVAYISNPGDIYVVGTFNDSLYLGNYDTLLISTGGYDAFIAKYNGNGNFQWARKYGGIYNDAFTTCISIGTTVMVCGSTGIAPSDIVISEYSPLGQVTQTTNWGGLSYVEANDMAYDFQSGKIFLTGSFKGNCDFDPGLNTFNLNSFANSNDAFIAVYDRDTISLLSWAKKIGNSGNDGGASITTSGSNLYAVGTFQNIVDLNPNSGTSNFASQGGQDVFCLSLTKNGVFNKAVTFGGIGNDSATKIISYGYQLYIAGKYSNTVDFDPGPSVLSKTSVGLGDAFLTSYGTNLLHTFTKTCGSKNEDEASTLASSSKIFVGLNYMDDINVDPGISNLILGARSFQDAVVLKYNSNGSFLSHTKNETSGSQYISCFNNDKDNNIVAIFGVSGAVDCNPGKNEQNLQSAYFENDFLYDITAEYLTKYDSSGQLVFSKELSKSNINSSDFTSDIICTSTKDIILIVNSYASAVGVYAVNVKKFDSLGNQLLTIPFDSYDKFVRVHKCATDTLNNIFVFGTFFTDDPIDFDPGPGTFYLADDNAMFVAKYSPTGSLIWVKGMPISTGTTNASQVRIMANGDIFIGGSFTGTTDFNPNNGVTNVSAVGNSTFVVKLNALGSLVWVKTLANSSLTGMRLSSKGIVLLGTAVGTIDLDPNAGTYFLSDSLNETFLCKWDLNGNFFWGTKVMDYFIGTAATVEALSLDKWGNAIVSGTYGAALDFDPGNSVNTKISEGETDAFFTKFDDNGLYVNTTAIGGDGGFNIQDDMRIDNAGNILFAGRFTGQANFYNGTTPITLSAVYEEDIFLCKYTNSVHCVYPNGLSSIFTTNTATLKWNAVLGSAGYQMRYRKTGAANWTTISTSALLSNISGLLPATAYEWNIRTKCATNPTVWSAYSLNSVFTTAAPRTDVVEFENYTKESHLILYPNPAHNDINLMLYSTDEQPAIITLSDIYGRTLNTVSVTLSDNELNYTMNLQNYESGIYIITVNTSSESYSSRFEIEK